jgi:hypothetical protein
MTGRCGRRPDSPAGSVRRESGRICLEASVGPELRLARPVIAAVTRLTITLAVWLCVDNAMLLAPDAPGASTLSRHYSDLLLRGPSRPIRRRGSPTASLHKVHESRNRNTADVRLIGSAIRRDPRCQLPDGSAGWPGGGEGARASGVWRGGRDSLWRRVIGGTRVGWYEGRPLHCVASGR